MESERARAEEEKNMADSFVNWWQHLPGSMDPVMFGIGPLHVRWYGFMYLVVLGCTYFLSRYRIRKGEVNISLPMLESVIFWGMVSVLVGARLGYVLFYNFPYYSRHPLEIFLPVEFEPAFRFVGYSGMSFHGGLIGLLIAILVLERRYRLGTFAVTDLLATTFPLGYTFGRLGNFINGELYGRVTDGWYGMYFPYDPTKKLRHPSQLYEAFLEGIVLFTFMWSIRNRKPFRGFHSAVYLIGYGILRFIVEFARKPDDQLGLLAGGFSMGQYLCMGMIVLGTSFLVVRSLGK